jgi:hypothetical protein
MAEVTFTPNLQPAPACYPSDVNAMLTLITTGGGISGTIPDQAGGGIFVGATPPGSSLTNKVWFKTDAAGRPLAIYEFYNGNWRKVYTGAIVGEIRMYFGSSAAFDGTGRGIVGGDLDGWCLCNGNNGTPNLHNFFPCMSSNYGAGWVANPDPNKAAAVDGGQGAFQITCLDLPDLWAQSQYKQVQAGSGANALTIDGGAPVNLQLLDLENGCQPAGQTPVDNTPPWVAMAAIMFVGYQ